MSKVTSIAIALLTSCVSWPASAATYLLTFDSPKFGSAGPFSGSMTVTTSDQAASDGSYAITNIAGSGTYRTKTYTYTGPIVVNGSDNKLFPDRSANVFDLYGEGFSMTSGSTILKGNIFYYGSTTNAYMWSVGSDNGVMRSFSIVKVASPVPEASSWALMMVGLGLSGALLRRRTAMRPFEERPPLLA